MVSGKKRSIHADVEGRLAALRRRLPERTAKTVLQTHIDDLLSLNVGSPCKSAQISTQDGKDETGAIDEFYFEARAIVGQMRTECIRAHGRDVWEVPEVKSAIEKTIVDFYMRVVKHNMAVCFEALEKHVENAPLLRYLSGDREMVSVVEFEKRWKTSNSVSGLGENHVPVEFELPGYKADGIEWGVKIVTMRTMFAGSTHAVVKYFASDARPVEMECENPETKMLGLVDYINTCLHWPRVHRAECLYDAVYNILEKHIRQLSKTVDIDWSTGYGNVLQQVLKFLEWKAC